ncbi:D-ribose pyranase [Fusibacter bizertensis]
MKKGKLLNSDLVSTIAKMGHTDQITIADAGLPIPNHVKRIDLAVTKGLPSFLEVLKVAASEMLIEKVILAEEILTENPSIYETVKQLFADVEISFLSHEDFKKLTNESKAIVRTGECTPFANIILQSGVNFSGDFYE